MLEQLSPVSMAWTLAKVIGMRLPHSQIPICCQKIYRISPIAKNVNDLA